MGRGIDRYAYVYMSSYVMYSFYYVRRCYFTTSARWIKKLDHHLLFCLSSSQNSWTHLCCAVTSCSIISSSTLSQLHQLLSPRIINVVNSWPSLPLHHSSRTDRPIPAYSRYTHFNHVNLWLVWPQLPFIIPVYACMLKFVCAYPGSPYIHFLGQGSPPEKEDSLQPRNNPVFCHVDHLHLLLMYILFMHVCMYVIDYMLI